MDGGEKFILNHLTCPHCWAEFHPGQLVWIAQHEDLRGDPVIPDGFIRFRPSVFNADGDALDARGLPCNRVACPRCHMEIPRQMLEFSTIIFSVIGTTFSGKSYFLATSTWQLRKELGPHFGMAFSDADAAANTTLTDFQKTLFSSTQPYVAIEKTQTDAGTHYVSAQINDQWISLPKPFIYTLTPTTTHPAANGQSRRHSFCICYYDNAGEHFRPGEDTALTPVTMHMAKARVLMFVFDPTQDIAMRKFIAEKCDDPQIRDGFPTDLQTPYLTEAVERIRRHAHLQPSQRLDTPLLILVSKADTWAHAFDIDITTEPYQPSADGELWRVDIKRIEAASAQVRQMLLQYAGELVSAAESISNEVLYLPVSSLGCSPQTANGEQKSGRPALVVEPSQIRPQWTTVPLIYPMTKWSNVELFKQAQGDAE